MEFAFWKRWPRRGRRSIIGQDFHPDEAVADPPSVFDACPYIALDAHGTRASWTSAMHRCFAPGSHSRRISPAYQEHICFVSSHSSCPMFPAMQEGSAGAEP